MSIDLSFKSLNRIFEAHKGNIQLKPGCAEKYKLGLVERLHDSSEYNTTTDVMALTDTRYGEEVLLKIDWRPFNLGEPIPFIDVVDSVVKVKRTTSTVVVNTYCDVENC